MTRISLTLPESLKVYVEDLLANGTYATLDDYVLALIQQDQDQTQLDRALAEAIDSGEATPMTDADWSTARDAVRARISDRYFS